MPFYLRSSCPGLPGRQKRPQSSYTFTSWAASSPSYGHPSPHFFHASAGPKSQPRMQTSANTGDTTSPRNAPASALTVPFGESQAGRDGLWQAAPRSPALQSPRLPLGAQVRSPWPGRGPCPAASRGWRGRQVPAAPPVPFSAAPCPPRSPSGGTARLKYQSRPSRGAQELTSAAPGF